MKGILAYFLFDFEFYNLVCSEGSCYLHGFKDFSFHLSEKWLLMEIV